MLLSVSLWMIKSNLMMLLLSTLLLVFLVKLIRRNLRGWGLIGRVLWGYCHAIVLSSRNPCLRRLSTRVMEHLRLLLNCWNRPRIILLGSPVFVRNTCFEFVLWAYLLIIYYWESQYIYQKMIVWDCSAYWTPNLRQ